MEQLREIGEVLGSIRALMVFKDNIHINQRQCTLLLDLFNATYDSVSESMRLGFRFGEKNTSKWKILEQPLRELLCVVREGEAYVRFSLEPKLGFWAKAVFLQHNKDCTELHVHNLLSCVPIIIEAIEMASELERLPSEKEIRHFFGDIDALLPQVTSLLSLSHPNIVYYLCGFADEEKKECFLVMELMSKSLGTHVKEVCGPRRKNTLSLPVAVDLMLQISRGMEYLHSKGVYHGELNPSNILVKPRRSNQTGGGYYLHGKICGFGLSSVKGFSFKSASSNESFPFIWYSPEVLEEQEQGGSSLKYTEKSDVYSFGMVCFELLTGKVPFEDSHLQGDKMSRNIRAGERPLFPFHSQLVQVSQVPFQMFAYRVVEQAKTCKKNNLRETSESGSEWASCSEDEGGGGSDEQVSSEKERRLSCSNEVGMRKKKPVSKRASGLKPIQKPGTPRVRSRHPPLSPCGQSMRTHSESQLIVLSPKIRRSSSGHVSDSELS
ncbi:hypothetical protein YC2023_104750 [Brassica napus]